MLEIHKDISLRPLNTMRVEGYVHALARWESVADLDIFFDSPMGELPFKIIGEGSNMLFVDSCFNGVLLQCSDHTIETLGSDDNKVTLRAGAGCVLDDLVSYTVDKGLWGLENLALIPGTAGAAAVQNVGAYGREFGQLVKQVHCYDTISRHTVVIDHNRMAYAYRDSAFKHAPIHDKMIITSVDIELSVKPRPCLTYGSLEKNWEASTI